MRTERSAGAQERIRLVFTLFDVNGNGVVEAEDFALMATRVVQAAPRSSEADKQAMRDALDGWWAALARELDRDGNGRVDYEEFGSFVLVPERFGAALDTFARALAALGDPDGDGRIARPDFLALMTAIGFRPDRTTALFDAFGPDSSDRIAVDTWIAGIRDYYAPQKSGTPVDLLVPAAGA
ncbi:EF-hand domain-containing protein [Streptomyces marincola]|uniref:EF-hand domain-containing protein n=1 Tax=Streptomyces marincola TaxID=2878388 RepID=UPI001CF0FBE6|nr:EF-hand domain-containing protein [Streptomyces marincola]UCM89160.1 EF-hand domain-containing protein [Streptomyces marincola]